MTPVVTQNGSSLQVIIPKNVCKTSGIEAGDELYISSDKGQITLSKSKVYNFYTIGYEGRTVENFISKLKSKGITQLVDVREKPISRKKGFSKNQLKQYLDDIDIKYIHMPELGSPSEIRSEYKEGGSELSFFRKYAEHVERNEMDQVKLLEEYISIEPTAIMCFEELYCHCHRKVLAKIIESMGHGATHI